MTRTMQRRTLSRRELLFGAGAVAMGGATVVCGTPEAGAAFADARGADRSDLVRLEAMIRKLDASVDGRAVDAVLNNRRRRGKGEGP